MMNNSTNECTQAHFLSPDEITVIADAMENESMTKSAPKTVDVTALARSVLPAYRACYPKDDRLEIALLTGTLPDTVEPIMKAALDAADDRAASQMSGEIEAPENDGTLEALYRAADAAEAVWLALQPMTDMDYFEACVDAALNGRAELNILIYDEEKQAWV